MGLLGICHLFKKVLIPACTASWQFSNTHPKVKEFPQFKTFAKRHLVPKYAGYYSLAQEQKSCETN
jgi:hypothetical protein